MMFAQNPSVAKVGLLYSLSEPNSAKPIADAKAYLDTKGIEYVEQTANTNDEVVAAASALIAAGVDAVAKIEVEAGHGGTSGRYKQWEEVSYENAWCLSMMGIGG